MQNTTQDAFEHNTHTFPSQKSPTTVSLMALLCQFESATRVAFFGTFYDTSLLGSRTWAHRLIFIIWFFSTIVQAHHMHTCVSQWCFFVQTYYRQAHQSLSLTNRSNMVWSNPKHPWKWQWELMASKVCLRFEVLYFTHHLCLLCYLKTFSLLLMFWRSKSVFDYFIPYPSWGLCKQLHEAMHQSDRPWHWLWCFSNALWLEINQSGGPYGMNNTCFINEQ